MPGKIKRCMWIWYPLFKHNEWVIIFYYHAYLMQQIDRCWKWTNLGVSLTNFLLDGHLLWHDIQSQWLKQSIATIIMAPCQPRLHHVNPNLWCTRRKAHQFYVISLNNYDHNHSLPEWKLGTEKPDITLSKITQCCNEHPNYWGITSSSGFEFK